MSNYYALLKDPRWQKKRLEALESAGWGCENCGDTASTLNVHHPIYVKGRKPWEYTLDELQVLCEKCHKEHHESDAALKRILASNAPWSSTLRGLCGGFMNAGLDLDEEDEVIVRQECPDGVAAGMVARLFFNALRAEKGAVIAFLTRDRALNPAEQLLVDLYVQRKTG